MDSTLNQACCAITEAKGLSEKFLFYWFLAFRKIIVSMGQGGGQPNISQSIISNLRVQTPQISEQSQISEFLDKKTTQFDNDSKYFDPKSSREKPRWDCVEMSFIEKFDFSLHKPLGW